MRSWRDLKLEESIPLSADLLKQQDAVVLITDHSDVDYDLILANSALIIDTRGVYRNINSRVVPA